MGLEFVEFIMSVEEAFGIEISDVVSETLTTPRSLIEYIYTAVPQREESAGRIAARIPAAGKPNTEGWSRQEITGVVRSLVSQHFEITEFSLDDRFGQEINVD